MPGRAVRVIVKAVEEWVPYVPTSGQTEIEVSTAANAVLARVTLTFPSAGYRVADWGVVRRDGSELWVDARVERWTGPSAQVITPLSHVYNLGVLTPGAYKFTFKAWGQAVKSKAFEVSPLKITISANPTSGKAPLTVWFAASASGGIPPYGYEWSFGDGGTSAEQSPSHTYAKPGLYVARCTVRDSAGAQSAAEVTIRVEAEAVALSFQPSEGSVTQGDIYEVKVVASQVSKLDTAVFTLSFDPSVLEFVEAKAGELMPNAEVASNVVSSGRVRVLVSQPLGAAGVTGSGSIAVIRLRAVGPSGSSTTLSLLDVSLADSDGNPIRATTMSGSVKVTQITDTTPPSVTVISPNGGEVWLSGELHAVKWTASDNVGVTKVDIFYSTDGGRSWAPIALGVPNTGSYNWKVPNVTSMNCLVKVDAYDAANNKGGDASDSLFTIVLKGDMNRDGRLDTGDATIILRKVVGLEPTSPEDVLIGDMNGSKALDSGDATIVLKRVVGLE
jgi:PKD repeat protein